MADRPPWVNRETYHMLQEVEKLLDPLLSEIERLDSCGVDCQHYRDMARALLAQARAMRTAFFDPPPV